MLANIDLLVNINFSTLIIFITHVPSCPGHLILAALCGQAQ